MPKIRQNQEMYAKEAFCGELRAQIGRYNIGLDALANQVGVSRMTVSNYLKEPGAMKLDKLRLIVEILNPDPVITLEYLNFKKSKVKEYMKNEQV